VKICAFVGLPVPGVLPFSLFATVAPLAKLKLSTVLNWLAAWPRYPEPSDAGATSEPTAGVVFALRFRPNCGVPRVLAAAVPPMPVIVLEPEVRVVPLTVIIYPVVAFVEAAICEDAIAVSVGEKS